MRNYDTNCISWNRSTGGLKGELNEWEGRILVGRGRGPKMKGRGIATSRENGGGLKGKFNLERGEMSIEGVGAKKRS